MNLASTKTSQVAGADGLGVIMSGGCLQMEHPSENPAGQHGGPLCCATASAGAKSGDHARLNAVRARSENGSTATAEACCASVRTAPKTATSNCSRAVLYTSERVPTLAISVSRPSVTSACSCAVAYCVMSGTSAGGIVIPNAVAE